MASFSVYSYRQFQNKNYALKVQMYVELLRYSIISPCKQYSEWVFTFLVFVLPKLILPIEALNAKLWYGMKSPWLVLQEEYVPIFSPTAPWWWDQRRNSPCACLAVGTERQQATEGRLMCFMRELHVGEYPIICYRNLSGAWKLRNRMGQRMMWAGMLPRKLWGGARVQEDESAIPPPTFPVSTYIFSFGSSLAWNGK